MSIPPDRIPQHVAIVMDGNGRWASERSLPRTAGHKQGAENLRNVIQAAADFGVRYVTLFGFSTENWKRPADEVGELMRLMRYYLQKDIAELHEKGARLRMIGDRTRIEPDLVKLIENAEATTASNDKIHVTIAFSYGGRDEIVRAAQQLASTMKPEEFTEAALGQNLMTADLPDVDLFIRTSGEQRISNFLLWQSAYAELVFSPAYWPAFGKEELAACLTEYAGRDRRFGGLSVRQASR